MTAKRLPLDFYLQTDVVALARALLGKVLVTELDGARTGGRIVEVEAYRAPDDRACHAFGNRRTARTETMFQPGGRAYIYLCYGIHHLFNVVTAPEGMAHAVLIRALEPLEGFEVMAARRGFSLETKNARGRLCKGPGALSQAMGLHTRWNGRRFDDPASPVWIEDRGGRMPEPDIVAGPRIGVAYAGECAAWEWRFWERGSVFVSKG